MWKRELRDYSRKEDKMKTKPKRNSAQYLIDNCEPHGKIVWKELREKVNKDRELGARNKEYLEW
jgi:hypothetical protein